MSDNKPTKIYKQGQVSVSVWERENAPTNYTFQRSYKDGEEWKYTNNLNLADLYVVQKIIARITSETIKVHDASEK